MARSWLLSPRFLIFMPLVLLLVLALACGSDATPTPGATSVPATAVPATAIPVPTAVPATATPVPTAVPPTAVPPAAVPPAAVPTPTSAVAVPVTPTPVVAVPPTPGPTATSAPKVVGVQGGDLRLLAPGYAEAWDIHPISTVVALVAVSPLYNQVMEFNPIKPSEVQGDLAKSWERGSDGKSYIFTLHDNVKFQNGDTLTAEDVAFSIMRMIAPGEPRPRTGLLRTSVLDAVALTPSTVKVNLNFASASFINFLAVDYMAIVNKKDIEAGVDINLWENINGSGPYVPLDTRRGDFWTHEKNPNYFKEGKPYFDTVSGFAITDPGTTVALFKTGQLDMSLAAARLGVDDVLKLADDLADTHTLYFQPMNSAQYIEMNWQKDIWKNAAVIRAMRLGTEQIEMQNAFGSGKHQIGAPFPVGSWYGRTVEELSQLPGYGDLPGAPKTKAEEIAEGVALLKATLGDDYATVIGPRKINACRCVDAPERATLWARQMKRNLNLDISLDLQDVPTAVAAWNTGSYDIGMNGYGFNIADPDDFVPSNFGKGRNWSKWVDQEFLDLDELQSREPDREARKAILRKMEDIIFERGVHVETNWKSGFNFVNNKIRTEAGEWVVAETIQTVLKQEHQWFEE